MSYLTRNGTHNHKFQNSKSKSEFEIKIESMKLLLAPLNSIAGLKSFWRFYINPMYPCFEWMGRLWKLILSWSQAEDKEKDLLPPNEYPIPTI